jgi:assimilatory nitrate reductase catalytic subunit
VLFRAAAYEPRSDALLGRIEAVFGLDTSDVLRYADKRRGQRRCMKLVKSGGQTRLEACLLAGDTQAESWIAALLQDQLPAGGYGRLLLVPGAKPPGTIVARSRQVCSCFDVREDQIAAALRTCTGALVARLAQLQERLKCGTNCGSCKPEVERWVRLPEEQVRAPVA